ncbi:hypothetical protein FQN60_003061 [Etheostoma spectabile]|uniref:Dual specificity protein phosphatase n=1 Tax=Etheostoma spectabile TaxID=54343 RepID=A0A5J5CMD1_9PERO|nr:hypothetical protein FQN60_003061 [Etheostoma spectabile]
MGSFRVMSVANDRYSLWKLGISHVLNVAHGSMHCQGSHDFYGSTVDYYGVPADDSPYFDLSRYFFSSAEYIQSALDMPGGRVFVHCAVGVSRSASIVLAYLMIHQHYTLLEAINKPAADFIHKALKAPDGKVLVHCIMGMSRSSTLVLAYLMIYHHLTLKRALQKLIEKRAIYPNRNFLALLLDLDLQLTRKKKTCQIL